MYIEKDRQLSIALSLITAKHLIVSKGLHHGEHFYPVTLMGNVSKSFTVCTIKLNLVLNVLKLVLLLSFTGVRQGEHLTVYGSDI